MPTKSSARWIADGDNMVLELEAAIYQADLQDAHDARYTTRLIARP